MKKIFFLLTAMLLGTGVWANPTSSISFSPTGSFVSDYVKITPVGTTTDGETAYFVVWKNNAVAQTKVEALNGAKIKLIAFQDCNTDIGDMEGDITATSGKRYFGDLGIYTIPLEDGVTSTTVYATAYANSAGTYFNCKLLHVEFEYPDHPHHYTGPWHSDEKYHWQECDSKIGCCEQMQGNKAVHNYGESGEAYYTCQTCGYVSEARQHTHIPAATWSYDQNKHWHACISQDFVCTNSKLDLADHVYGNTKETYHICQVCGAENQQRKKDADADYFSLTAIGADMTIGMVKHSNPHTFYMQYSTDKMNWTSMTLTQNSTIVTIPAGQTYYFRSAVDDIHALSSEVVNCYWSFLMTGEGTVQAAGNLYSLLGKTYETSLATSIDHLHFFTRLFYGCAKLTAVKLNAFNNTLTYAYPFEQWLDGTAVGTTGVIILPDNMVDAAFLDLPTNWICKQKLDYIDQVTAAAEGIKSSNTEFLLTTLTNNIKTAIGNSAAKAQRDVALKTLMLYSDGYNQGAAAAFLQPTEPGLRLKVTKKDGNVYEFQTIDLEGVEYYRAE